ncbi:hypothetical protein [Sorangium sp. So ce1024]|uniref:hypothetical protein n=1 Tax=Sorangium sp. So ce1024 TaxID=3133327 RepID=UPI003F0D567E
MSSTRLSDIIDRLPGDRSASRRLVDFLERAPKGREFAIERLYEETRPPSKLDLANKLIALVQRGVLDEFVRVESVRGGGIADFPSVVDVPDVIHDVYDDRDVRVQPENVRVLYKVHDGR